MNLLKTNSNHGLMIREFITSRNGSDKRNKSKLIKEFCQRTHLFMCEELIPTEVEVDQIDKDEV